MLIGIDASRANVTQKTGTEYYSASLVEWLAKIDCKAIRQGKENNYLLYVRRPLEGDLANLPPNFQERLLCFPRLWTQIRLSWEMLVRPPDILFVPAHVLPIIHPRKSVVTIHDLAFNYFPECYDQNSRRYLEWTTKFALRHARHIIAISETTKNDLIKFYKADPKKISVVYLAYNTYYSSFQPEKDYFLSLRKRFGITKPYLLSIGRIEHRKNILNVVRAFGLLIKEGLDYQLVLAGKPGFGSEQVFKEIKELRLEGDIIIPGYVSEKDSLYLMHNARTCLVVSLYEGFGMTALEAMASGVPTVVSNRPALSEISGNATLQVDPIKPDEIAKAVFRIAADRNLREKLINEGYERIKLFSWERCARETLAILEGIGEK